MDERRARTILLLMLIPAPLSLAGSALVYTLLEPIAPGVGAMFATLWAIFGVVWFLTWQRAWRRFKRKRGGSGGKEGTRASRVVTFALLFATVMAAAAAHAAEIPETVKQTCYTMYQRVFILEMFVLGMVGAMVFLMLMIIFLAHTPVGEFLRPFMSMVPVALTLFILTFLLVYPLHVMFDVRVGSRGQVEYCVINMNNLVTRGPPLLRLILRVVTPPSVV